MARSTFDLPLPTPQGPRVAWGQLHGASLSLCLTEAAARHDAPVLVVAGSSREADQLHGELQFFADPATLPVVLFPDYETLPYDLFSPHPDLTSQRLATLSALPGLKRGIVVASIDALLQRLPPRAFVDAHTLQLKAGERIDIEAFRTRLAAAGYSSVSQVVAHGEFAVRGSLIDLYPMGAPAPYRVDLFDDTIESIRTFDPETQRSTDKLAGVRLLPAREFPLHADAIKDFRRRYRIRFEGDLSRSLVYKSVSDGHPTGGIEYYLPLFFEAAATLFDYLPAGSWLADTAGLEAAAQRFHTDTAERYEQRRHDIERPLLAPGELFLEGDSLDAALAALPRIDLSRHKVEPIGAALDRPTVNYTNVPTQLPPPLRLDPRASHPAAELAAFIRRFQAEHAGRVLIAAESAGRREVLLEQLRQQELFPKAAEGWWEFRGNGLPLCITVNPEVGALYAPDAGLALITEEQLFGERARQERRRRRAERDPETLLRELKDLAEGAPVVHEEHGVGRYRGLQVLDIDGQPNEFLVLEYLGGDKLYVPVQALDRISRYTGAPAETAPWHKLGGDAWAKAKRKAAQRVRDVAAELLDLYARRAAREGEALPLKEQEYAAFAAAFPFEETHDQAEAIRAVLADLASGKPMDRVICGDVGFGKTEVALRAAFAAVQAGRQVAVLVPTTLLAQQHYQNFADRLADWPVKVESLSRFRSTKEANAVLKGLEAGTIDIVVGTHRLLSPDLKFKQLGLVIIDEEHRFGVRDKERLKTLRANVDVLTLTATPIPRTLNMALGGLRDLSLITTPPADRLAVQTFVCEWNAPVVREAFLREIRRGGQLYFLHNAVESIEKRAEELRLLVPEADIRVGHGQMRERDLEQLMLDFYHRRFNVLVCTTIVESGIDVPTANTIIIDRADKLGLAQLHQLRGRVGRSHHRAYAYLLTPPKLALTPDAKKRLEAIESLEELGAGFTLATHDLEIRGAGELLGDDQSGQMQEVGFAMYMDLLDRAVKSLKAGKEPRLDEPLHSGTEVNLNLPALIPDDYMPDVHLRLRLYKRIAAAEDAEGLADLRAELVDRFGPLPTAAGTLLRLARLKQMASPLGLKRLEIGPTGGVVQFAADTKVEPAKIIKLVQKEPKAWKLDGQDKLRFYGTYTLEEQRFAQAEKVLGLLTPAS
jgi:transcription-repair coupling factor (superfamily II helicase)